MACATLESVADDFAAITDRLEQRNVVLLGATYSGKTHRLKRLEEVTVIEHLSEVDAIGEEVKVAFDDFYPLFMEFLESDDGELCEKFTQLLMKDRGLCISTRPRSFDWLVRTEELEGETVADWLQSKTDGEGVFDAFDFFTVDYSRSDAIDKCFEIESGLNENSFDERQLQENIDRLKSAPFEFQHPELSDLLLEEGYQPYQTYLPFLVVELSELGETGGIFWMDMDDTDSSGLRSALRDIASSATLGEALQSSGDAVNAVRGEVTLDGVFRRSRNILKEMDIDSVGVGLSGFASSAVPIFGPLLLWGIIRDGGEGAAVRTREEVYSVMGGLLGDELLPHTRAYLEEEMAVAPMTIECFQVWTNPTVYADLRQLMAEVDAAEIQEFRQSIAQHSETLEVFETSLETLEEEVEEVQALVASDIAKSAHTLAEVGDWIATDESRYLFGDDPTRTIHPDEIPTFGSNHQEDISNRVEAGQEIIVVKGPTGVGKTVSVYQAGRLLEEQGYTVRVPDLHAGSVIGLETRLNSTEGKNVLVTSYQRGRHPVSGGREIVTLIDLIEEGACSSLVIECRDELFRELNEKEARDQLPRRDPHWGWWQEKQVINVNALGETGVRDLIDWVFKTYERDPATDAEVQSIHEVSEGNPAVSKIAARFVATSDESFDPSAEESVHAADDLIWRDLKSVVPAESTPTRRVLQWIAVTDEIMGDELRELLASTAYGPGSGSHVQLGEVEDNLGSYLSEEIEEGVWRLTPEVYADVVFRFVCLDNLMRYVQDLLEAGFEEQLFGVVKNLQTTYYISTKYDDEERAANCIEKAEDLLQLLLAENKIHWYGRCVNSFARTGFPLTPDDEVLSPPEVILGTKDARQDGIRYPFYMVAHNTLSSLATNHAVAETGRFEDVLDYAVVIAELYSKFNLFDVSYNKWHFLVNLYSGIVVSLFFRADTGPFTLKEAESWLFRLEEYMLPLVKLPSESSTDTHLFGGLYSRSISHLSDEWGVADGKPWIDVIESHAKEDAGSGVARDMYFDNLYSNVIIQMIEGPTSVIGREEWVSEIGERIETGPGQQADFYSMTVAKIMEFEMPGGEPWLGLVEKEAVERLDSDTLDRFYLFTLIRLFEDEDCGSNPDCLTWVFDDQRAILKRAANDTNRYKEKSEKITLFTSCVIDGFITISVRSELDGSLSRKIRRRVNELQPEHPDLFERVIQQIYSHLKVLSGIDAEAAWKDYYSDML